MIGAPVYSLQVPYLCLKKDSREKKREHKRYYREEYHCARFVIGASTGAFSVSQRNQKERNREPKRKRKKEKEISIIDYRLSLLQLLLERILIYQNIS